MAETRREEYRTTTVTSGKYYATFLWLIYKIRPSCENFESHLILGTFYWSVWLLGLWRVSTLIWFNLNNTAKKYRRERTEIPYIYMKKIAFFLHVVIFLKIYLIACNYSHYLTTCRQIRQGMPLTFHKNVEQLLVMCIVEDSREMKRNRGISKAYCCETLNMTQ